MDRIAPLRPPLPATLAWPSNPRQFVQVLLRYGRPIGGALVFLLAIVMLASSRTELARAGSIIGDAEPGWVLAALAGQITILLLIVAQYRMLLARMGHQVGWLRVLRAQLSRFVVATVVPFGGLPSIYIFVRDLARDQVSADDAVFATVLHGVAGKVAFVLGALPLLLWLAATTDAPIIVPIAICVLLGLFGLVVIPLALVLHGDERVLRVARRLPPRLFGAVESARAHDIRAKDLVWPMVLAFAANAVTTATLYACLRAVGPHPSISMLVSGRLISSVVGIVAPIFHGAGVMELTMSSTLHKAGVPAGAALASSLLFRISQFWFPLVLGCVAMIGARRLSLATIDRHRSRLAPIVASLAIVLIVLVTWSVEWQNVRESVDLFQRLPNTPGVILPVNWVVGI